ncbi:MAG: hypothetical protein M3R27_07440 [Bacteroidota bacterium]|nr:hypothetical protein [Bacteroidota bacterium]
MKKMIYPIFIFTSVVFSACEGGQYDSSGNGAVIRETNKDDMDQLEGKDGDKVTIPNSGTDKHSDGDPGHTADPTDSTHLNNHHGPH